jgi:hypothetical protein
MYIALIVPPALLLSPLSLLWASIVKTGMTAASVLPEPVGATSRQFTFLEITGSAFCWIVVSFVKPSLENFSMMSRSESSFSLLAVVSVCCSCGLLLLLAGFRAGSFINHYRKEADHKQSYRNYGVGIKVCNRFAYHAGLLASS